LHVEAQHLDATTHRLGINAPEYSAHSPDVFFDRESFGMGHRAAHFAHKAPKHRSAAQDPAQHDINIGRHLYSKGYKIDIGPLVDTFKGGGTSSYHPAMLLKILVYAYLNNVYSSRRIEAAVKENIHFMWLAGMKRPDHNTINRFRGQRLKKHIKEVFTQVVLLLMEAGHVDLKAVYTDGTKLEANANKYTFVWGK